MQLITEQELKEHFVKKQLLRYGIKEVEGLSYKELVRKLAVARALEVNISTESNKFF